MKGYELERLFKSDVSINRIYGGMYPRDKLPQVVYKKPIIYIVNTDLSSGKGMHWVCIFIGVNDILEYWDSFGFDIRHREIKKFVTDNSKRYIYNNLVLQPVFSETCGYFCLFYARKKSRGLSMRLILRYFRALRPHYNDSLVCR